MQLTPLPPLPSEPSSPTKELSVESTGVLLQQPGSQHAYLRVGYGLVRSAVVGELALRAALHIMPDGTPMLGAWQLTVILAAMILPFDLTVAVIKRVIGRQ